MADLEFPSFISGPVRASKSRENQVAFRENNAFSGPPFIESLTDDTPSIYNIEFRLARGYKRAFIQWFESDQFCNKGREFFNINLLIESGIQTQEARFLSDGVPQLQGEEGGVFSYTARIIIRDLNEPDDEYPNEILFLVEGAPCGTVEQGAQLLDYVMNLDFPQNDNQYPL